MIDGGTARHETIPDVDIRGLTADSRRVRPGYLFAAIPGRRADGRDYIPEALRRGAVAVLAPPGVALADAPGVALLTDDNPRRRLALMAARFCGAQPSTVAAVTGTNGKTSVVGFTRQIWERLGRRAASVGTLGVVGPVIEISGNLTTPDPVELHRILADLAASGVDHLALEASSHGLDQYRLDGVRVTAAAFTNLSRDHLDYHGAIDDYLAAKRRLFDSLLPAHGAAVLNADVPEFETLAAGCRARGQRVLSYGAKGRDIRLDDLKPLLHGQRLVLTLGGRRFETDLPLVAAFQATNALCALGLVLATGGEPEGTVAALAHLSGTRGRMELVAHHPNGAAIYVDYAHTPDALENALRALRPHTKGRLAVVFGCGGERDPGKRPLMGEIAARLADRVIVSDDNPRGEDAAAIRREILAACPGAREIGDRAEAIAAAVAELASGDVLILAGKGHEQGQIVGDEVHPFDDEAVAHAAVARLTGEAR